MDYLESIETPDFGRLSWLQDALIGLIDLLDPDCVRFPRHLRNRMTMLPEVTILRSPSQQASPGCSCGS
jgi:hypothetical protein